MYVIFPADELIYMTYGVAVPRLHPRPTLDNLREPIASIGLRPSPPRNLVSIPSSPVSIKNDIISEHNSDNNLTPLTNSYEPSPQSAISGNYFNFDIDKINNIHNNSNNSPVDDYNRMTDQIQHQFMRDSSPSIYLEPPSPDLPSSRPLTPNSLKTPIPKAKQRPKLTLSLGRLGRQQPEQIESVRLREDTELKVANPTFTHENLCQRNYDAFFESGEPVYSLERKIHSSPEPDSCSQIISQHQLSSGSGYESSVSASPKQRSTLKLFQHHSKSPTLAGRSRSADCNPNKKADVSQKESPKHNERGHRSFFSWRGLRGGSLSPQTSMASYSGILKDFGHTNYNEALKTQNSVSFKLVKTVSDFTETLSHLYEEHASALQNLVSSYRKRNGELRKERPACHSSLFHTWETFLQEIEADSQASSDVASTLSRQVSRPMLDRTFHRKVQSRKIFTHRESFDTIIAKTEEKLTKCRADYKQCHAAYRQNPNQHSLSVYIEAHNAYVQQLHATNAMLEAYNCDVIPQLMQELDEIYSDLCSIVADSILHGAEVISSKANEQSKRYDGLTNQCRTMSPQQDLNSFVRILPQTNNPPKFHKKTFSPPIPLDEENPIDYGDTQTPPPRDELFIDRNSSVQLRPSFEALKREAADLELQIRQLQDSVDALVRTQTRGIENQLYNKANELQEDLSMKKFDLRAKQLHFAAVKAQKELFQYKLDPGSPRGERKLSTASSTSMKTKWLKAFRSLKPASGPSAAPERRNGAAGGPPLRPNEDGSHHLQEYTYKKITPCDVCSQILRGHTRQGLRCRICKLNAHADCASQLPRCQPKAKLLRRQKSTSELENRVDVEEEKITDIDQIFRALKQAGELNGGKQATTIASLGVTQKQQKQISGNQIQNSQHQQQQQQQANQDIPTVNVPECPERTIRWGPTKKPPSSSISGIGSYQHSKGLIAPSQDFSSSDIRITTTAIGSIRQMEPIVDLSYRRRVFAGFRPLSLLIRGRVRSAQHRSISLPETPHSPRRHKLNLRMKSLSLDSPESTELHGQNRRRQPAAGPSSVYYHCGSGGHLEHSTPPSNNSRLHSPSSPSQQRKLLHANRGLRTGSVDLPDDMEKSLSSASTSPCPSPVRQNQKSHRLLPTNLYVVLYNFKARHTDELDLKAGYKVTVIDTSDPDWWKGKCLGRIGYFPSKYCARLNAGEKPLQVTHNLQVSDGDRSDSMTLLRDQIVIQAGEEVNGMVMVRSADNRQGLCPMKYLQEV